MSFCWLMIVVSLLMFKSGLVGYLGIEIGSMVTIKYGLIGSVRIVVELFVAAKLVGYVIVV